ncbi:hypothetical protein DU002_03315 [Corallincola holothuriorum]|uniref:DUF1579 domain-containing protein n=1 Tax=Corallincola holothuriorum TaxID=2282215 RepID=A0A368NPC5_9GAMM|nr:hypothetical protein [Corallincola holothuriorum]RCU51514.1 hypothetical protein DU002_03315 [Corallincola holothuriorum]
MLRLMLLCCSLFILFPAHANNQLKVLSPVIGHWTTKEGNARQHFYWGVGERIIHGYMEIPLGDGWQRVSEGSYHWDPVTSNIRGTFVGINMGISLFYVKGAMEGGKLVFHNRTLSEQGQWLDSVETWTFGNPNSFEYVIEKVEAGHRKPWLHGQWLRVQEEPEENQR